MRNIALSLRYLGNAYHGWQVQKNAVSVAGTIESALEKLQGHKARLTGCGRTDAGVHALAYCANFRSEARIPAARLPYAINALLPRDISVLAAEEVPDSFCAIRSCVKKEYVYKIHNARIRDPFLRGRACFLPSRLDYGKLAESAAAFEGRHDFAAMRSLGSNTKTTVRTVYWCRADQSGDIITITICADGFLYNMARTIAGTCVYAGLSKLDPSEIPALLLSGDRSAAGPTMPPEGLYLNRLWYAEDAGLSLFGIRNR